jgi:rhodanese-related sulfurtransferase
MKLAKIITLIVAAGLTLSAAGNKKDLELKNKLMSAWKAEAKAAKQVTKGITDKELIKWMDDDKDFILVDVREPDEVAAGTIMAMEFKAIPRGMVSPKVGKGAALKPSDTIVFYCKHGIRSAYVAKELQEYYGFKNVYYLKGGIIGWIKNGHEIHNKLGEFVVSK